MSIFGAILSRVRNYAELVIVLMLAFRGHISRDIGEARELEEGGESEEEAWWVRCVKGSTIKLLAELRQNRLTSNAMPYFKIPTRKESFGERHVWDLHNNFQQTSEQVTNASNAAKFSNARWSADPGNAFRHGRVGKRTQKPLKRLAGSSRVTPAAADLFASYCAVEEIRFDEFATKRLVELLFWSPTSE
ncbi:unnamed protein product [Toxocara canis]|uniref:Uncharacterized protein n=1 Tax=Toxocara canis TaxID=6265 RepID=A0A183UWQ9_TOXCA|nr:unnamed protein product [Toxocara canis]